LNKLILVIITTTATALIAASCNPYISNEPMQSPVPEPMPEPQPANRLPVAYIDSVTPNEAVRGEPVSFQGHGNDSDGSILAYRWRSSLDGDLDTIAAFETASLSEGNHTISLMVQDNEGDWSEEVTTTLRIVPPEEPAEEPFITYANWNGRWDCGVWGIMTLTHSGEEVNGTYTYQGGIVTAVATGEDGRTLLGTWSEDPSHMPPKDAGDIEFIMTEDSGSFTGHWRYDSSGSWQSWDGERLGN